MNMYDTLSLLTILFWKNFNGGFALLSSQGEWVKAIEGICSATPPVALDIGLVECGALCTGDPACKAFFYTYDSRECRLQESALLSSAAVHSSPSSVYFTNKEDIITPADLDVSIPQFQTVYLDNNEFMTFRVIIDSRVLRQDALQGCSNLGANFVQIMTQTRQDFFETLPDAFSDIGGGPFWIDVTNKHATDFNDPNGFTTEDGQSIPALYWVPGQPSYIGEPLCAVLAIGKGNKWQAKNCATVKAKYICEL